MSLTQIKHTALALLCGILAAAFVSACSSSDSTSADNDAAGHSEPAETTAVITGDPAGFNDADVTFATMMIPHHEQAIELAGLAGDRSTNPELLALAQQISGAQEPEITTMNAFLVQWRGGESAPTDHSGHADMAGMVDEADMARLATLSGAEFDTLWLQSMIAHHEGAIDMAENELAGGSNPDAKKLAQDIVTAQQAEIEQMQTMLAGNP